MLTLGSNAQNVGINTNTPTEKLEVNGNIKSDTIKAYALKIMTNAGVNKILRSDALGNASWQTPVGSGATLDSAYKYGGPGAGRIINANNGAVLIQGTDGFQVTGLNTLGADLALSGSGTRMFFYPKKSAFRAGNIDNDEWDKDSIGQYSFAVGKSTKATGTATAVFGEYCSSKGGYSTSWGSSSNAVGSYSTAGGYNNIALGPASLALNSNTEAKGYYSTALGYYTTANSNGSLVIGSYNDTIVPVNTSFGVTDPANPLFIIGNGTAFSKSNAMVVKYGGNIGIGTNNPSSRLEVNANTGAVLINGTDGLQVTGTHSSGADLSLNGAGTRMFFYPKKSAFRAGKVTVNNWDLDSIGNYSFAGGYNPKAKGDYSIALGTSSEANGIFSTAVGYASIASAEGAMAYGGLTKAKGLYSLTFGKFTEAIGDYSSALGYENTSLAYNSFSVGRYNDTIAGSNSVIWVTTDPLFIIGNGTNNTNRNNAFVVYKNGNTVIDGDFTPSVGNTYSLGKNNKKWTEVWATNGVIQTSDENLKQNITSINYGLSDVLKMHPVSYQWKNGTQEKQIGFIAQEIEKIIPEAVVKTSDFEPLGMKYTEIIPVLTKAIQQQQIMIEELKKEIRELKNLK